MESGTLASSSGMNDRRNPFRIGVGGTREEVIEKYRVWIQGMPVLLAQLSMLKGKRLGCYCAPRACHGSVLKD